MPFSLRTHDCIFSVNVSEKLFCKVHVNPIENHKIMYMKININPIKLADAAEIFILSLFSNFAIGIAMPTERQPANKKYEIHRMFGTMPPFTIHDCASKNEPNGPIVITNNKNNNSKGH